MSQGSLLSDQKRKLLEKYLRHGAGASSHVASVITPRPLGEDAPLSLAQEQLVAREDQTPNCPALYNESIIVRMQGRIEPSILERSLLEIIRRHEIWRTSYRIQGGQWRQFVHPPGSFSLATFDLRAIPSHRQSDEIERIVGPMVAKKFDLKNGPLLRGLVIRLSDWEQWLCLCAHLSIVDGMSVYQILPSELCALYRAFSSGEPSPLPNLELQYGDYAWWQRQPLQCEERARQINHWRKHLRGSAAALNWPNSKARSSETTFRGTIRSFDIPKSLVQAIKALSQSEGVTLFLSLLAALVVLLHGYTKQETIVVGSPSPAGRERQEVQGLLGHFLTPVALCFDLAGDPTFKQLLRQAQQLLLDALANDDVPLEILAGEINPLHGPSRNPFFAVVVSQQPSLPQLEMDWNVTSMDIGSGGTPWDVYLAFIDQPHTTIARVQYNTDLFEVETIERMMVEYCRLLEELSRTPAQHLSELRWLSENTAPACWQT